MLALAGRGVEEDSRGGVITSCRWTLDSDTTFFTLRGWPGVGLQTQRLLWVIVIIILISLPVTIVQSHCSPPPPHSLPIPAQSFNNQPIKCRIGLIKIVLFSSEMLNIENLLFSTDLIMLQSKVKLIQSDSEHWHCDHLVREGRRWEAGH